MVLKKYLSKVILITIGKNSPQRRKDAKGILSANWYLRLGALAVKVNFF